MSVPLNLGLIYITISEPTLIIHVPPSRGMCSNAKLFQFYNILFVSKATASHNLGSGESRVNVHMFLNIKLSPAFKKVCLSMKFKRIISIFPKHYLSL